MAACSVTPMPMTAPMAPRCRTNSLLCPCISPPPARIGSTGETGGPEWPPVFCADAGSEKLRGLGAGNAGRVGQHGVERFGRLGGAQLFGRGLIAQQARNARQRL